MVKINFHEPWAEGDLKLVMFHAMRTENQNEKEEERGEPIKVNREGLQNPPSASATSRTTDQDNSDGKKGKLDDEIVKYVLYANAACMKMWSPVFTTMLKDDSFKEGASKEVKLTGKRMEDVLELLEVLHPPNKPVTIENAHLILLLAHEFHIQEIVDQCETCIVEVGRAEDLTIPNIQLADDYGLEKLRSACIRNVGTYYPHKEIVTNKHFISLSQKSQVDLMSMRITTIESKITDMNAMYKACSKASSCQSSHDIRCSECADLTRNQILSGSCSKKVRECYKNLFL